MGVSEWARWLGELGLTVECSSPAMDSCVATKSSKRLSAPGYLSRGDFGGSFCKQSTALMYSFLCVSLRSPLVVYTIISLNSLCSLSNVEMRVVRCTIPFEELHSRACILILRDALRGRLRISSS